VHDVAPTTASMTGQSATKAATDAAFKNGQARGHEARHRQQPPDPQRHGAARRDRRIRHGEDAYTLYTTSQNPHVARLVSRPSIGMCARAQAARDRAGRRRRLRLEDLHLCRGDGLRLGLEAQGWRPPGQVDRGTHRGASLPTRMAATIVTKAELAMDASGKIIGLRVKTIANLGAYLSTFSSSRADLSLRHAAVGPVQHPASMRRSMRSIPTPRRSMPIAAQAVRKRPSSSSASWKRRRAN
jgi:carbon-monoxide dehydrogenase large subunit